MIHKVLLWLSFVNISINAQIINILISPGAVYYETFFKTLFWEFEGGSIVYYHETEVKAMNRCEDMKFDLIIRGWWNKQPSCPNLISDVFISSEPWDSSFTVGSLLIDCKLSRHLLPPTTSMNLLYFPFYSLSFSQRYQHSPTDLIRHSQSKKVVDSKRTKFCAFIAKNCMHERIVMMNMLNQVDSVDALGSCGSGKNAPKHTSHSVENSIGSNLRVMGFNTIDNVTYLDRAVEAYTNYKFVLCIENSRIAGYVTEKIVNAFLAGAVPIYIGAPDIEAHFDARSFINCNRVDMVECVQMVKRVHENKSLYMEMQSHSVLPHNILGRGFQWYFKKQALSISPQQVISVGPTGDVDTGNLKSQLLSKVRNAFSPSIHEDGNMELHWPDLTYVWRPQTKYATEAFLGVLDSCPINTSSIPTSTVNDINEYSVQCQVQMDPSEPPSFIACEPIRYLQDLNSPSQGLNFIDVHSISGYLKVGGDDNIKLCTEISVECENQLQSDVMTTGTNPASQLSRSIPKSQSDAKGSNHTVVLVPSAVTISKVDSIRLHDAVARQGKIEFHMQFKPNVNAWIDMLISSLRTSTHSYGAGRVQGEEADNELAQCLMNIVQLSPTLAQVYEKAAGIIGEDSLETLLDLRLKLTNTANQLVY